jgi:hypothetical protein
MYAGGVEPRPPRFASRTDVDPGYDPLQLAIDTARARGLEVHAWFNPFRAGNASDTARLAPRTSPACADLRRVPRDRVTGGGVGPGSIRAERCRDHTIAVMKDVVQRYDIDALHIDDFFYPYPNGNGALTFPDDSTYARYTRGGGTLTRGDWRRDNINRFVERMYTEVKRLKPWVRVGISPFGIWRPGNPQGVTGLDAYNDLFADSRLWLQRGWSTTSRCNSTVPSPPPGSRSTPPRLVAGAEQHGAPIARRHESPTDHRAYCERDHQLAKSVPAGRGVGTILAGSVFDNRDNIFGAPPPTPQHRGPPPALTCGRRRQLHPSSASAAGGDG